MEEEELDSIRELEGMTEEEFNDLHEHRDLEWECDSSDVESFHSDESNKDDEDDDLMFDINVDHCVKDNLDRDMDNEVSDDDNNSVYAESDEERMACNSPDDEEDSFPVFNEDVDMEKPEFQLTMCFKDSKVFRQAVKRHAILERRPIENVRHYGRKVKYVCQPPCPWMIYASPIGYSDL